MSFKKNEPHPAKGAARIDNRSRLNPDSTNIETISMVSNSAAIQKDARVLQFLKSECQRTGAGSATLQQVFTGLLSVHNRHLVSFADALAREAN